MEGHQVTVRGGVHVRLEIAVARLHRAPERVQAVLARCVLLVEVAAPMRHQCERFIEVRIAAGGTIHVASLGADRQLTPGRYSRTPAAQSGIQAGMPMIASEAHQRSPATPTTATQKKRRWFTGQQT
ncbi:hypothetical protein SDC9_69177 [bioreactor metagenome]|uniref:Uncharacterized protein n=1 Tax=bioreactor metagenome TaxID=1076179 RepID=A0A644Y2Z8_9ZZZZ